MHILTSHAIQNGGISRAQCAELLALPEDELFASATAIREHFFANKVETCFIINAKSGNCN